MQLNGQRSGHAVVWATTMQGKYVWTFQTILKQLVIVTVSFRDSHHRRRARNRRCLDSHVTERCGQCRLRSPLRSTASRWAAGVGLAATHCSVVTIYSQFMWQFIGLSSASIRQRLLEKAEITLVQAFELADGLDRAQRQALSMGQTPTQLLSSTTFDPQREVHDERPKASFSYPDDGNMNHSLPSCPATAVAQRRVKKAVGKRSGNKCFFCDGPFHPRYLCPARDATCLSCGKPGHFARACQSHSAYNSSKAVVSVSSIAHETPTTICSRGQAGTPTLIWVSPSWMYADSVPLEEIHFRRCQVHRFGNPTTSGSRHHWACPITVACTGSRCAPRSERG